MLGRDPPPQKLFELGGNEALPGYRYKEFAGDRAALFRTFASYRFDIWRRPVQIWRNLMLPGLSPGHRCQRAGRMDGAVVVGRQAGRHSRWVWKTVRRCRLRPMACARRLAAASPSSRTCSISASLGRLIAQRPGDSSSATAALSRERRV